MLTYFSKSSRLPPDTGLRLTGKYSDTQLAEYNKHKDILVGSSLNAFFGKLRNYIQHYGIPPLGWTIHLNNDKPNDCIYYLSKERLLEWNGWGVKAKSYINNGDINLLECIQEHGEMIDTTYRVLINTSSEIHGDDINVVNDLIRRRNDILSGKIKV